LLLRGIRGEVFILAMKKRSPLGQAFAQLTNLRIAEREPKMAVRELVSNFRNRAYVTITVLAD
jgi:hypothetical protein